MEDSALPMTWGGRLFRLWLVLTGLWLIPMISFAWFVFYGLVDEWRIRNAGFVLPDDLPTAEEGAAQWVILTVAPPLALFLFGALVSWLLRAWHRRVS